MNLMHWLLAINLAAVSSLGKNETKNVDIPEERIGSAGIWFWGGQAGSGRNGPHGCQGIIQSTFREWLTSSLEKCHHDKVVGTHWLFLSQKVYWKIATVRWLRGRDEVRLRRDSIRRTVPCPSAFAQYAVRKSHSKNMEQGRIGISGLSNIDLDYLNQFVDYWRGTGHIAGGFRICL